jgi:predicted membrane channel-forming protein YqfA (hemolysin III family)
MQFRAPGCALEATLGDFEQLFLQRDLMCILMAQIWLFRVLLLTVRSVTYFRWKQNKTKQNQKQIDYISFLQISSLSIIIKYIHSSDYVKCKHATLRSFFSAGVLECLKTSEDMVEN